jgi:hypothetical protein
LSLAFHSKKFNNKHGQSKKESKRENKSENDDDDDAIFIQKKDDVRL